MNSRLSERLRLIADGGGAQGSVHLCGTLLSRGESQAGPCHGAEPVRADVTHARTHARSAQEATGGAGGDLRPRDSGPSRGYGEAAELRPRPPALQDLPGEGHGPGRVQRPRDSHCCPRRLVQLLGELSSPWLRAWYGPNRAGLRSPGAPTVGNGGARLLSGGRGVRLWALPGSLPVTQGRAAASP